MGRVGKDPASGTSGRWRFTYGSLQPCVGSRACHHLKSVIGGYLVQIVTRKNYSPCWSFVLTELTTQFSIDLSTWLKGDVHLRGESDKGKRHSPEDVARTEMPGAGLGRFREKEAQARDLETVEKPMCRSPLSDGIQRIKYQQKQVDH